MAFTSKQTALWTVTGVVAAVTVLMLVVNYRAEKPMHVHKQRALGLTAPKMKEAKSSGPPAEHNCSRSADETELDRLLSDRNATTPTGCVGYYELRGVNFLSPALAQRLCKRHPAYQMVNNRFPTCEVCGTLPNQLVKRLSKTVTKTYLTSAVTNKQVTIFTYPLGDIVSDSVIRSHGWEQGQVALTLSIAKKFPAESVTFLDIGCNIGVYALQAREAGIPTVAVDANLRNVLRVRMSANAMGWPVDSRFRLLWMYFHKAVSLQYISFGTHWCNVGAGAIRKSTVTDTIPIMAGTADDLLDNIGTKLVVMKIDIESSEYSFLSTGLKLFKEKDIVTIQMEWWRADMSRPPSESPNFQDIINFLTKRNYAMFSMGNLKQELDFKTFRDWDVIWIRRDFLKTVRG